VARATYARRTLLRSGAGTACTGFHTCHDTSEDSRAPATTLFTVQATDIACTAFEDVQAQAVPAPDRIGLWRVQRTHVAPSCDQVQAPPAPASICPDRIGLWRARYIHVVTTSRDKVRAPPAPASICPNRIGSTCARRTHVAPSCDQVQAPPAPASAHSIIKPKNPISSRKFVLSSTSPRCRLSTCTAIPSIRC
jgi:hypothetical protein